MNKQAILNTIIQNAFVDEMEKSAWARNIPQLRSDAVKIFRDLVSKNVPVGDIPTFMRAGAGKLSKKVLETPVKSLANQTFKQPSFAKHIFENAVKAAPAASAPVAVAKPLFNTSGNVNYKDLVRAFG